jgi:hypothetical protein
MGAVIAIVALVTLGTAAVVVSPSGPTVYECIPGGGCTRIMMAPVPSPSSLEGSPAADGLPYSQPPAGVVQGGAAAP